MRLKENPTDLDITKMGLEEHPESTTRTETSFPREDSCPWVALRNSACRDINGWVEAVYTWAMGESERDALEVSLTLREGDFAQSSSPHHTGKGV